ncbi:nucleoside phosphorylase [Formosa algae]|uniref:Uridine phosphorylase n=1 Tax=Formosa algae TaxID=225843 RepID=A0A9X0YMB5_9FLAO|nr:nucleoside phosphorylase [Formosa algae]MBP1841180.1 uridine phosphorylase [Formosa algae]MDQ0336400.1 uridine phosphorylase [Formosa algae]OEI81365.1 phosphorylase [Formosa algae]PNW27904.1 phosphorylase [Formosa algae]
MPIKDSELILNPDGSVYHLNLRPEHIANTIILVGDQDRVSKISKHFDTVEYSIQKREFKTETGVYKGKRLSVVSTGIGCDNIDIVLNELDALVNIDFETRTLKTDLTSLNIIRVGTSGSLQKEVPVDSFALSAYGLDFSGMLHFYDIERIRHKPFEDAFVAFTKWNSNKSHPVLIQNSKTLEAIFASEETNSGVTATASGFYGPQGRVLRLTTEDPILNDRLHDFDYDGLKVVNFEMETAAIYGLSALLGHNALSLNAIIANRATGQFSENPGLLVERLISYTLNRILSL